MYCVILHNVSVQLKMDKLKGKPAVELRELTCYYIQAVIAQSEVPCVIISLVFFEIVQSSPSLHIMVMFLKHYH
jgi:hypothetical protein